MKTRVMLIATVFALAIGITIYGFTYKGDNTTAESKALSAYKSCPKLGQEDCPLIQNCPKQGQPDCPIIENCPLKGTPDCPYEKGIASCCSKK